MRRAAGAATSLACALVLLAVAFPFLAADRLLAAAVPQPAPLVNVALVPVAPGERACLSPVAIDHHSEVALIRVATRGRPGVPLTFALDGADVRQTVRAPGGYPDNALLRLRVRPPGRPTAVSACVRNDGDRRVELYAADDRTRGPAVATVGGRPATASFMLAFMEARPASLVDRAAATADRVTRFRPGGPWLAWVLGALVLVGIPSGLTWAVAAAARADDETARLADKA